MLQLRIFESDEGGKMLVVSILVYYRFRDIYAILLADLFYYLYFNIGSPISTLAVGRRQDS